MTAEELVALAWKARERAYAPYSKFPVGAALVSEEGEVFTGCNVENLSFGLTICAERTAAVSMIVAGARRIAAVAVVADTNVPISPCGACRQFLAEFGAPVINMSTRKEMLQMSLADLLPRAGEGILDFAAEDVPRGT